MANEIAPARKFLELARLFYDRGLVFFSFLTLLAAFFCASSEDAPYRDSSSQSLDPMPLAWAGDAREIEESEHDKRANWLNARRRRTTPTKPQHRLGRRLSPRQIPR